MTADITNVLKERGSTHGDFKVNFCHTANLWAAYLHLSADRVTPLDVAQMMVVFKTSRAKTGRANFADHYDDQQGYARLAAKVAEAMDNGEIALLYGQWTVVETNQGKVS